MQKPRIQLAVFLLLIATAGNRAMSVASGPLAIEPKLPFRPEEELQVRQDDTVIEVSGETFSYKIDRSNGLITGIKVLEDIYSRPDDPRPFPDTHLSPARDPERETWWARNEKNARVEIVKQEPEEVVIEAVGRYRNGDGEAYPASYRITYQFFIDGVVFVHAVCRAEEDTFLRYLVFDQGTVPTANCKYLSHLPDLAFRRGTGDYRFGKLATDKEDLLSGVFLPWFWLGSEKTGIEITTWDVNNQHYRPVEFDYPKGYGMGDYLGNDNNMFFVKRRGDLITWTHFTMRNAATPASKGWEIDSRFALGITPPKKFKSRYLELRPAPQLGWGDEESIRDAAVMGANYMEGGMSVLKRGESVPYSQVDLDNESIAKSYATYNKYGIRAIPYYSLTDFDERDPMFQKHGLEWVLEPGYGFRFRTSGICPSVKEWRDYWKGRLDQFIEAYPVDGVYFDMWYGKLDCENWRHGCGTRFRRITFPWLRDMLAHAYNSLHRKDPDGLIFHNLNVCNVSMISSFCDVRLVGEARDIAELDPVSRYGLYFSYRLGCQTAWSTYYSRFGPEKEITFGLLIGSLLPRHPRDLYSPRKEVGARTTTQEDIALRWKYYNIFRFFKASESTWYPALSGQDLVKVDKEEVFVNVYLKKDKMLLVITNLNERPLDVKLNIPSLARLGIKPGANYCVYNPLNHSLVGMRFLKGRELNGLGLGLGNYGHAILYIARAFPAKRQLVFGLGLDGVSDIKEGRKTTSFLVNAPDQAQVELVFYSPGRKPRTITQNGDKLELEWKPESGITVTRFTKTGPGKIKVRW